MIAVMVNTFLRDEMMYRCVKSVEKHIVGAKIYLTDNGRMTKEKRQFYDSMVRRGHYVEEKPFNYWWRKAFNEKLNRCKEDYILKIDDDFYFDDTSSVNEFVGILQEREDVGLIGGQVWHEAKKRKSDFIFKAKGYREDGVLEVEALKPKEFMYCDFVPDFWMARRSFFETIYMPEMGIGEGAHEVFFRIIYELRREGLIPYEVAYTDRVKAIHEKSKSSLEYNRYRHGDFSRKHYKKNIKMAII